MRETSAGAPAGGTAPRMVFRTFDEKAMLKELPAVEESVQAYEEAKIVSQRLLDYQVCV